MSATRNLHRTLVAALAAAATGLALAAVPAAGAATAGPVPAAASAKAKAKPFKVTLQASNLAPQVGKKLVLKGKVSPGSTGSRVVLQKRWEGKKSWSTEAHTKVGKASKFEFTAVPIEPGEREYRVVKAASGKRAKGVSEPVSVTVFAWRRLADLSQRTSEGFTTDTSTILGEQLEDSLAGFEASGARDYNLARDCTDLRAVLGLDDVSDDTATTTINLVTDGTTAYTRTFALTQSETVQLPLTGVFRLGFTYTAANPASEDPTQPTGVRPVVGTPEVLCSF